MTTAPARRHHLPFLLTLLVFLVSLTGLHAQQAGSSPVKIFILAGQSNMLGQGDISPVTTPGTLEHTVANDPAGIYQFLKDGSGNWVVRNDVWIRDQNPAKGGLTVGYGADSGKVGPELGFGHFIGDLNEQQVLLVKAAWGGKSLAVDFRPPSSGGTTGFYYNEILRLVTEATTNLASYFPDYNGGGYEIVGFGWHQGWNDRVTPAYSAEYQTNMANFIRDMRSALGKPNLPFVIATTGMGGGSGYSEVELAQLAMTNATTYPDFVGDVKVVDTRIAYEGLDFWKPADLSPADEGYHWNRNAKTYTNIGLAMGDAMSILAPGRSPFRPRAVGAPSGVSLSWQNGTEVPTSVRILRNGVEIAAAAPTTPSSYLDATALPGAHSYEFQFTMPVTPSAPLTTTFNGGITGLTITPVTGGLTLNWINNMGYTAIEVRRDGIVLGAPLSGTATSFTDTAPPSSGTITYTVAPTTGTSTPASALINLDLACEVGVLDPYHANGGINPATGQPWAEGDTYRLIFVTSGTIACNSSNIATYNTYVQGLANAAGLGTSPLGPVNWKVVGSTAAVNARTNTATNPGVNGVGEPILRMDGTFVIANSYADLWNGINITHVPGGNYLNVHLDENGVERIDERVRTGTSGDGTAPGDGRVLGGSTETPARVQTGRNYAPDVYGGLGGTGWMQDWSEEAASAGRVYAISEPLTIINLADNSAPTLLSITDDKPGGSVTVPSSVTYTVTFSEPMNASTVGVGDFENDPSLTTDVTISSAVPTANPAAFLVTVATTEAGSLRLRIKAGAVLTDLADNELVTTSALPDNTTIVVNAEPELVCQLGVLNLSANGGINPATGQPWAAGNKYRLIFVTSGTTACTSPDISTYNTFVQGLANASTAFPALGSATWKVVGSTASVAARDNTGTNPGVNGVGEPVFRMDGTFAVATNYADLWNGIIASHVTGQNYLAIHLNENGVATLDDRVRTGTTASGTASATQMLGTGDVQTGRNYTPDFYGQYGGSGWMQDWHASGPGRVYAISEPLTIANQADNTKPTLVSITDDKPGGSVTLPATVTYTVTFSEAMTASTVDASDFENASPTATTIGSVAPTSDPKVFLVQATPTAAGTLQLQIKAGAILTDLQGNAMLTSSAIPDNTTIVVNAPPTLVCPLGVLNLSANGGINPATGQLWKAGDKYRLIFVTSGNVDCSSTNITSYNTAVQGLANASTAFPALGSLTWKVVGSTASVAARDNTDTNPSSDGVGEPIIRMDGSFAIANNYADLWNGINASHVTGQNFLAVHLDENGVATTDERVRTGSNANGTAATQMLGSVGNVQTGRNFAPDFYGSYGANSWMADWNAAGPGRVYALSVPITLQANYANILSFGLPGNPAVIRDTHITLTVPYGTDVTALAPTFTLSPGATCVPVSGTARNFTTPQTYTVTSSDSLVTQQYTATVVTTPPPPEFTLTAPANWDGRQTITVQPDITNLALLQATGGTNFTYQWSTNGVPVVSQQITPGVLTLTRSQGSGTLVVTLTMANGTEGVTESTTIQVQEPATEDPWVERTPGTDEKPVTGQFFARNPFTNLGTIHYNGTQSGTPDSVFLKVYQTPSGGSETLFARHDQSLVSGAYAFAAPVPAGLFTYRVVYGTKTGVTDTDIAEVTNLVCGDAYLIEGQSNAQATDNSEPQIDTSYPWIYTYDQALGWGPAYAKPTNPKWESKIGFWGMKMAREIVAQKSMPVCIINGSVGGTRIDQHQPNPTNHTVGAGTYDIYANLLNRVIAAKLTHGIRGVFWHQGESDCSDYGPILDYDYTTYQQLFLDMSAAWKQDYPNFQRYLIFQVMPAPCLIGPKGDQLREVQRTLPFLYSKMSILNTLGLAGYEGCHFSKTGYENMAARILPVVYRDFYGVTPSGPVTAPNLKRAYFTSPARTAIALEFDQAMSWSSFSTPNYFVDDVGGKVTSGSASGNIVTLQLNAAASANATLDYLKDAIWNPGEGVSSLLYGANGIPALTFADVPIGTLSPYETWAGGSFAHAFTDTAATSDPDGDDMSNQEEFAFGLDPTTGSSVNPITQQLAGGVFKYTRTKDSGLTYKVYYSTTLSAWTLDASATQSPATAVGGVETVTVTLAAAAPSDGKLFVRVEATPTP